MDDENYRDLARKAWELSNAAEVIQRSLMQMFFNEFVEFEREAFEKQHIDTNELPF